jgi:3-hydroxy-3-methylglutaryl CoA synthase
MASFGILSYGAYIPRRRISRTAILDAVGWAQPSLKSFAKGARAFAAWDEDAITMAVEAARDALAATAIEPDALCFTSTTAPFLDRLNAGVVAAALDLPSACHVYDMAGSQRAASSALIVARNDSKAVLIASADRRPTKAASQMEMLSGDAGAAVLVGAGNPLAEIVASHSIYADLVDHYRTADTGAEYALEERWYRDEGLQKFAPRAVAPLLDGAGVKARDISRLIVPVANPAHAGAVAESIGVGPDKLADGLFASCGHAGAAHPLLMLTATLDNARAGDLLLLTAFGQGCDAILLRVTDALQDSRSRSAFATALEKGRAEENYIRFLAAAGVIDIDWGMRAERDNRTAHTVAYDKSRDVYGFVGGFCGACSTAQFPKSRRCVNPACGALDAQTDYRFADRRGAVKSFTEDWMAFTREPPLLYGNVSFEGGGNVFMEMCDFAPGEVAIGSPVRMNFRIKDIDAPRGFHRYFWKAGPPAGGRHA